MSGLLHPSRPRRGSILREAGIVIAAVLVSGQLLAVRGSQIRADVSASACVAVGVIGIDGGTLGNDDCGANPGSGSGSSASSSSVSSSAGSSSSAATGGIAESRTGQTTTDQVVTGGYRYSRPWSHAHIVELLHKWFGGRPPLPEPVTVRGTIPAHAAPPSHPASSAAAASAPAVQLPPDVPADSWFAAAVRAFLQDGLLDPAQALFRPAAGATRAEAATLIVRLHGGPAFAVPLTSDFDDVLRSDWFFATTEEAAAQGWMRGYRNCYGSHPCEMRPNQIISRAEAVAVAVRYAGWTATGSLRAFPDVPAYAWYAGSLSTAADHCVLRGDDVTGLVRPDEPITRAELVTLLRRMRTAVTAGNACGTGDAAPAPLSSAATAMPTVTEAPKPEKTKHAAPPLQMAGTIDPCTQPSLACFAAAVRADAGDWAASVLASWRLPNLAAVTGLPASEPLLWFLGLLWLVLGVRVALLLARHVRHRT